MNINVNVGMHYIYLGYLRFTLTFASSPTSRLISHRKLRPKGADETDPALITDPQSKRSCFVMISCTFNNTAPANIFDLPPSSNRGNISEVQDCVSTSCFGKFSAAGRGSVISRTTRSPKRIASMTEGSFETLLSERRKSQYSRVI